MEPRDCLLYLRVPPACEAAQLRTALAGAGGMAGAVLLLSPTADAVRMAQPVCAEYGAALVLDGDAELAVQLDADGAQVPAAEVAAARKLLGAERIVGAACGSSRDAAMKAGDAGADYVLLAADAELITWWQEYFVLPCVAEAANAQSASLLVQAGADFIATDTLEVAALCSAITEALQKT